jgi:hypothetical protein
VSPLAQREFEVAIGAELADRAEFAAMIGAALDERRGFAAGKLGGSEQAWMLREVVRGRERDPRRLRAFDAALGFRSLRHAGIWPTDARFQERFSDEFAAACAELDAIGLFADAYDAALELLSHHRPPGRLMRFEDQEPPPDAARDCWLEHLRNRRVLLVCPFAELLRERARRDVYEATWKRTGKRWFEPASVDAVELPYGFEPATQERFATALDLLADVDGRVAAREFDVALIATGGLGIPLAARIKRRGGVAISLGGHLQVLFGVRGDRWRERPEWEERFTDAWIDVPERHRPDPALTGEDYW